MDCSLTKDYSPMKILLFCGKRKSGKDFITDELSNVIFPSSSAIVRLSGPIKKRYAQENNLDEQQLLGSSEYKEQYRAKMITWSEAIR